MKSLWAGLYGRSICRTGYEGAYHKTTGIAGKLFATDTTTNSPGPPPSLTLFVKGKGTGNIHVFAYLRVELASPRKKHGDVS